MRAMAQKAMPQAPTTVRFLKSRKGRSWLRPANFHSQIPKRMASTANATNVPTYEVAFQLPVPLIENGQAR